MFKMDTFIYLAKFEKNRTILTCLNYQSNLFVTNVQNINVVKLALENIDILLKIPILKKLTTVLFI